MLARFLFPDVCAGCGSPEPSPCSACIGRLVPLSSVEVPGVDECLVVLNYDELSRRLVAAFKYRGQSSTLDWFASAVAARVAWAELEPDLVTWAPALPASRRRRGFDQGQRIATRVAGFLGLGCAEMLARRGRRAQTGSPRDVRLRGPDIDLVSRAARSLATAPRVLVIDDVVTTGATLSAVAQVLRASGAGSVVAAAVAHPQDRILTPA